MTQFAVPLRVSSQPRSDLERTEGEMRGWRLTLIVTIGLNGWTHSAAADAPQSPAPRPTLNLELRNRTTLSTAVLTEARETLTQIYDVSADPVAAATTQSVAAQSSSLSVHLRNDARLGDNTLEAARQLVSGIYSQAGLRLIWANDEAALTVVLRPRASKQTALRAQDAMGYTPGDGAERGRLAFVIVNRVHEVSDGYRAQRSVVLGVAIAHELGHLLISNEHSAIGIMKPSFNQSDFRSARNGRLLFTDHQARLLRNVTESEWRDQNR